MRDKTAGLRAYNAQRMAAKLRKPIGLTYDILHEVRRALRTLRKVEGWIVREHKAEKRRKMQSDEWREMQRIIKEENRKCQ